MKAEEIRDHLVELGYEARLDDGRSKLTVAFLVGGKSYSLVHEFPGELIRVPSFGLVGADKLMPLAHVIPERQSGVGTVCVGDADSISVNTYVPKLAYAESLQRHIELLTRLIEDPDWNRSELLREFHTNWEVLCHRVGTGGDFIYFAADKERVGSIEVRSEDAGSALSIRSHRLGLTRELVKSDGFKTIRGHAGWTPRSVTRRGVVVRVTDLAPAPAGPDEVLPWYVDTMRRIDARSREEIGRLDKHRASSYWVVFSAKVPGGDTWFAMHLSSKRRGPLPVTDKSATGWTLKPYSVRSLTRDSVVPRGGGALKLSSRSVLLVGCGSVGSELAERLTSAGIGRLTLCDPDFFSEFNLYRHSLSALDLGLRKSLGVALRVRAKHLWVDVVDWSKRLEQLRDPGILGEFDLIVIAIGAPTVERVFHEYCREEQIDTPRLNCWVEAYGIGGHAILDVPGSKGCWHCAHVDRATRARRLSSNLNFLEDNQDLALTHGGCGFQFLPYSGIAASYTGAMAADLSTRFLSGEVDVSSRMSWKGSSQQATERGFVVSHRYSEFEQSLKVLGLYNDACDVCGN